MATDILNALLTRAADTTKAWVSDNWSQPLGSPESILDNLISYDDEFLALWDEFLALRGWDDEIDLDHPDMQTLLSVIAEAHDSSVVPDRQRLGGELRNARMEAGHTIRSLAAAAGVTHQNITKIENGKYNVSVDIFSKVLRPLGKRLTIE